MEKIVEDKNTHIDIEEAVDRTMNNAQKVTPHPSADKMQKQTTKPGKDNSNGQRSRQLLLLLLGISAIIGCAYWAQQRFIHVYTDDARIAADMIELSSKASGWIVDILVSSGDRLKAGDTVANIDKRTLELKVKELGTRLAAMDADYEAQQVQMQMVETQTGSALDDARSQLAVTAATLSAARSELEFRTSEWERAQTLRKRNIISQHDLEADKALFNKAQQGKEAATASAASAQAKLVETQAAQSRLRVLGGGLLKIKHQREGLALQLEQLNVQLRDLEIHSPRDGIVDKIFVDAGEFVQPGRRLLLMHDPYQVWVSANIKETEIRHIKLGQAVAIKVDAYPDEKFSGEVAKIGHAATSQFSLLPSTNPSGNFTKVTQRIPIKIAVNQKQDLLKPGMMVEVAVDVR